MPSYVLTDSLDAHIANERLLLWRAPALSPWRALLVTPSVHRGLIGPWEALTDERQDRAQSRRMVLHALMSQWVNGGPLLFNYDLKILDPWWDGVWEFRTGTPLPGARLLGFIAEANVFVAVGLHNRQTLGPRNSLEWRAAIQAAAGQWNLLNLGKRPKRAPDHALNGDRLRDYWNDR